MSISEGLIHISVLGPGGLGATALPGLGFVGQGPPASLTSRGVFMTSSLSSDGTLNPNGVRFGSSEIYNIGMRSPSPQSLSGYPGRRGPGGHPEGCLPQTHLLAELRPISLLL